MDGNDFLRRMAARDERVFAELMPTIKRLTMSVCHSIGVHPDLRGDLVQEVALKVFRNWQQFQGRSQLATWIYVIARHHCIDIVSAPGQIYGGAGNGTGGTSDGEEHIVETDFGDPGASDADQRRCVQSVLSELDREPIPREGSKRKIELLRFCVEHSPSSDDLAAFLDTTVAGAKERKRYLLAHVRTLCQRFCGTHECGITEGSPS